MPVVVTGMKEFRKSLKDISKGLPKEITKLNKKAAEIVAPAAQDLAPVRTGRLRGAVRASGTQTSGIVRISGIPYAGPIVGGWPKHNIKKNPFIFRGLDAKEDEVIDLIQNGVADLIDRYM